MNDRLALLGLGSLVAWSMACGDSGAGTSSFGLSVSLADPTAISTTGASASPTTGGASTQGGTTDDPTGPAASDPSFTTAGTAPPDATTDTTGAPGVCGDGDLGPDEGCDDGPDNGPGKACKADCTPNVCGDGDIGPDEGCDDGPDSGPGKACKADCTPNICGDGDVGPAESCDDGNTAPGDACSPTCGSEGCGNKVVDPMEACDDGMNADNDDGCTDLCQLPKCGDGFLQASLKEACDDGPANSNSGACTAACAKASCGDGLVWMGMEACDSGANNSDTGACTKACKAAACGDGLVWMGMETCDDGNVKDGDGCSAACKLEVQSKCGNGVVDPGERCDTNLPPPFTGVGCKPQSCFYDFSAVPQLYCNGVCTWAGADDCDQADADIYCKLKTGNPNSTASVFQVVTALDTFGFACPFLGTSLGALPEFGVNNDVKYQGTSILANHGAGHVVANATCTTP